MQGGAHRGEARGEAEVGEQITGKTTERYCSGMPGRFCSLYNRKETSNVCSIQPGSEREDETDRLSPAGG